jgi:hypothetical protein
MLLDHIVSDSRVVDEDPAPRREQRIPPRHHLRRHQFCALLVLTLFGLHLLAARSGAGKGASSTAPHAPPGHASVRTTQATEHRTPLAVGMGAGASSSVRTGTTARAASCNLFDVVRWLTNAAQWLGQQITSALQSVTSDLLHSPLDIITQTPPADTYQNATVITWSSAFLTSIANAVSTSRRTKCSNCKPRK